jgi:membrane fusion protein, multidrug efflux system
MLTVETITEASSNQPAEKPGARYILGWVIAALTVLIAVCGLVFASAQRIKVQTSQLETMLARGPSVLVEPAGESARSRKLDLPATINGYIETPVYAKIPGYMKTILVDKGDRVRTGELIAVIESPETDKQVADALANYHLQWVTNRRDEYLLKNEVISQQAEDTQRALMLQARATYEQELALQRYEIIKAPFDGIVSARYVDPGTLIPQSTTPSSGNPIIAMATLQPVRVYAYVPQSQAPFIHDGDPATVFVTEYPGRQFPGSVTRHPDALNPDSRTMLVEVDLPNTDRSLYPGMYARLSLNVVLSSAAPTVPDDALIFRNNKIYVPVVRNQRLHLMPITLGFDDGYRVVVTSGLRAGDVVALNVGQAAQDGEPVRPMTAAQAQ